MLNNIIKAVIACVMKDKNKAMFTMRNIIALFILTFLGTAWLRPLHRNGGGGRIRTHGGLTPTTAFKAAAIDHSATPPLKE